MTHNSSISTGTLLFTFTDEKEHIFSSFSMNPANLVIIDRCEKVSNFFAGYVKSGLVNTNTLSDFCHTIEENIAYIVDCDPKEIFGEISAITILPSGDMFASIVLNTIKNAIKNEAKKRKAQRMKIVDRYTKEYDIDPSAGLAPGQVV